MTLVSSKSKSDCYYTQEKKINRKNWRGSKMRGKHEGPKDPLLRHIAKYDETCLPRGVGKLVRQAKERRRNSFAGRKKRGRKRVSCETERGKERRGRDRSEGKGWERLEANEERLLRASLWPLGHWRRSLTFGSRGERNAALHQRYRSVVYTLARAPLTCVTLGIRILEYRERLFFQTTTVRECLREQERNCEKERERESAWFLFYLMGFFWCPHGAWSTSIDWEKIAQFRFSDNSHVRTQGSKVCIIVSLMHRDDEDCDGYRLACFTGDRSFSTSSRLSFVRAGVRPWNPKLRNRRTRLTICLESR